MARWRGITAVILLVIGCLAVPLATLAVWLHQVVFDTETYVNTIGPLAENRAVTDAVADYATAQLFARIDVQSVIRDRLPDRIQFLAAPMTNNLEDFVSGRAREAAASDQFARLWTEANRIAHEQIIRYLNGDSEVIVVREGQVIIDLQPLIDLIKARLDDAGIDIFDNVPARANEPEFVVFESPALAKAQRGLVILNQLAIVLPIVAVVALGGALLVSAKRLRTLLHIGIGIAITTGLLLAGLAIGRALYLNAVEERGRSVSAAGAAFDILVQDLWSAWWVLLAISVAIALVAWLAGRRRGGSPAAGPETNRQAA